MNSIGNDIVDLNFIDKERTCQPNFYSKILTFSEQKTPKISIFEQTPFEVYVWLLWSAKEAIFKFEKRLQPDLVFSPVKICLRSEFSELQNFQDAIGNREFCSLQNAVNSDSEFALNFTFQNKTYHTCSIITSDYIATIANNIPDFSNIVSGINRVYRTDHEHQSAGVRRFFSAHLKMLYPDHGFHIGKSDIGYPVITGNQPHAGIIASFAHHGNYVAYAFSTK